MADSKLKMNDDKTELMAIGTMSKLSQVIPNLAPMSISGCDIPFSQSVRNLGFYLNETLSMDAHIKYLCRILFCQLHRIGKIRSFLSTDAANKLAVSLILSRLDYCNSLLAGIPGNKLNKLLCIQNHAARLVLRKSRHASATALLRTLHWLPVKARIQYKIACLCFSVSIRTVCHLIFLTFFIHTVPVGHCALLTPHCWQFLTSLLRPLAKVLSLFLDLLSGTHYHYPSEKHSVLQLFKTKLKTHLFRTHLCWSASVSFCVYHSGGVCVFVCVCVCVRVRVCVCVSLSSLVCVVGLFLCTLMPYIGFMSVLFYA